MNGSAPLVHPTAFRVAPTLTQGSTTGVTFTHGQVSARRQVFPGAEAACRRACEASLVAIDAIERPDWMARSAATAAIIWPRAPSSTAGWHLMPLGPSCMLRLFRRIHCTTVSRRDQALGLISFLPTEGGKPPALIAKTRLFSCTVMDR